MEKKYMKRETYLVLDMYVELETIQRITDRT